MSTWTQAQAITLCGQLEAVAPQFGCHVALTGGTLYKIGVRKDVDIVIYRIRQADRIDIVGLMTAFKTLGVEHVHDYGFCYKASYEGRLIDFLFPDRPVAERQEDGEYR